MTQQVILKVAKELVSKSSFQNATQPSQNFFFQLELLL